jgi:hypothetical protein
MLEKSTNNSASKSPRPPLCFGCARPMRLVRRTLRFGRLLDLYTFECRSCGVCHIEEGDASEVCLADPEAVLAA